MKRIWFLRFTVSFLVLNLALLLTGFIWCVGAMISSLWRGPLPLLEPLGYLFWIGTHSALVQWIAYVSLKNGGDDDDNGWDENPDRYPLPPLREEGPR